MWLRLRQIALVARQLAPVVDRDVFGLEVAYRDPGVEAFGLENAVLPVGNQFLEVVAPIREGTAATWSSFSVTITARASGAQPSSASAKPWNTMSRNTGYCSSIPAIPAAA